MSRCDIDTVFECLEEFESRLESLSSSLAPIWSKAVQAGWYPTSCMPDNLPCSDLLSDDAINECMLQAFEQGYPQTKQYILDNCAQRQEILSVAFALHEQENYIASIPLLLAQADGLFEEYLGHRVFTRGCEKLLTLSAKPKRIFGTSQVAKAYFAQLINVTHSYQTLPDEQVSDEIKAPTRNAILHGDAQHLDYGSYSNSCKSINFLSSVMWLSEQYHRQQNDSQCLAQA